MDYIIETDFEGPGFVAVPNWVAQDARLSPDALGVLVYLASLPRGYVLRVCSIRERFGIGKDRWQRIARDLRDCGALTVENVAGAGGRWIGRRVSVRWPQRPAEPVAAGASAESRESRPSDRKPGKPAVGKPAKVSRKIRQGEPENPAPYKDQRKTQGAPVKPVAPQQPPRSPHESGGAAVAVEGLGKVERDGLRQARSVVIAGELIQPDSPRHAELSAALRALEDAEADARWKRRVEAEKAGAS